MHASQTLEGGTALSPGHIVCVDDEEGILHVLRQQLAHIDSRYEVDIATSGEEALALIDDLERDAEPLAMVIADQIMPGMKGVELLREVHRRYPETMKILLTGQAGLDAVVAAINSAGLHRYIAKPWDEPDLRITVDTLLERYQLARERETLLARLTEKNEELSELNAELEGRVQDRTAALASANERLAHLAITDGLTGRYNHRYLFERLEREVERSKRTNLVVSLLMVDVDHFKRYNDRWGHLAGDAALRMVGDALAEDRRVNDIVARYGGEEFAVLLPDTPRSAAIGVADQVRARIAANPLTYRGEHTPVTVSIGVAACPDDGDTVGALVKMADDALYRAKNAGRNRVELAFPAERCAKEKQP